MKIINAITIIIFFFCNSLFSQEFVSTEPELRNVILEEFTGIHCGNCPGGHQKAKELADANPGRVVLMAIHEGSYAVPGQGEPDFRTKWGQAILANTKLSGFPAGTINRQRFPGSDYSYPYNTQISGGMALGPNGWAAAASDSVFNGVYSPLNIAAITEWNNDKRELKVDVEVYFTEDIPGGIKLNIAFLENHVIGPQTGAADPNNYEHNHILRDFLTGQWGESIQLNRNGLFKKTYTYQVSDEFNILNCDLALFATKTNNEYIFTGKSYPVIPPNISVINTEGRKINALSTKAKNITYNLKNVSDHQITFVATISKSERTAEEWSAGFGADINEFDLQPDEVLFQELKVDFNNSKGIGDFIIEFSEKDNPVSNSYFDTVTILTTDIQYLEIDGGGSNLQPLIYSREDFVSFPINTYQGIAKDLEELKVVFWNCGKTGRLNSSDADIIKNFITEGIGVIINGSGGLPTLTLENSGHPLFTTLGVMWNEANQIPIQTFGLCGYPGDPISDSLNVTGLSAVNNGYFMQSLDIISPSITFPIIKMIENDKVIGIRTVNGESKAVYIGFFYDIIPDIDLKNILMKKIIDWLEEPVSVKEDETLQGVSDLEVFFDSGKDVLKIKLKKDIQISDINIVDILGNKVKAIYKGQMDGVTKAFEIEQEISSGLYIVAVDIGTRIITGKFFK